MSCESRKELNRYNLNITKMILAIRIDGKDEASKKRIETSMNATNKMIIGVSKWF